MSDHKAVAVTARELSQLHEDVLTVFCQTAALRDRLLQYPYDRDEQEFSRWLKSHESDWFSYPGIAPIEARTPEALQWVGSLAKLTASISDRRELFFWFARAYVKWPADWPLLVQTSASRHDDAFAVADEYVKALVANDRVRRLLVGRPANAKQLKDALEAAAEIPCRHLLVFLYKAELPQALKLEAALAVELCDSAAQPRVQQEASDEILKVGGASPTFVPTEFQAKILEALNARALKKEPLASEVCAGDGSRLYRKNRQGVSPLSELIASGLIVQRDGLGYYRPDAPPPSAVAPRSVPTTGQNVAAKHP